MAVDRWLSLLLVLHFLDLVSCLPDEDHIICNCYMMCLLGSDELWKSLLLFISMLCFIYDLACSPMLVDALTK